VEVQPPEINLSPLFLWHRISDDQRIRLIGLNAQEAFLIWVKAALIVGLVLASPWVFWQIWTFVAAGLYPHEKRYVHVFLPFSLGLFLLGASVAFLFVFEPVLDFLLSFNRSMGVDPDPRISEWLGFVLILPLGFGVSFQLPLVMLFLERIGIFDTKVYVEKWRVAILVIFVVAMVLTPADPYSMLLMAVPLTFLYFGGVLLCKYLPKGRSPFDPD
jgi:sec-independent protein translocase protein TatC